MHSNINLTNFVLTFCGAPLKIYLHEYLTHECIHTRKFPNLWYILLGMLVPNCRDQ